jgi:hypothetical protein
MALEMSIQEAKVTPTKSTGAKKKSKKRSKKKSKKKSNKR